MSKNRVIVLIACGVIIIGGLGLKTMIFNNAKTKNITTSNNLATNSNTVTPNSSTTNANTYTTNTSNGNNNCNTTNNQTNSNTANETTSSNSNNNFSAPTNNSTSNTVVTSASTNNSTPNTQASSNVTTPKANNYNNSSPKQITNSNSNNENISKGQNVSNSDIQKGINSNLIFTKAQNLAMSSKKLDQIIYNNLNPILKDSYNNSYNNLTANQEQIIANGTISQKKNLLKTLGNCLIINSSYNALPSIDTVEKVYPSNYTNETFYYTFSVTTLKNLCLDTKITNSNIGLISENGNIINAHTLNNLIKNKEVYTIVNGLPAYPSSTSEFTFNNESL
ncbi:MAG: hypothetical protein ACRDCW_15975 [Sarcina sp.]